MSFSVFAAVLFSAVFQADWNFATKKSRADKIALLSVGWFLFGLIAVPAALAVEPLAELNPQWLLFAVASGLIHAVYICLLGHAYSLGEISVVYPVARGLGIVGTTAGSVLLGLQSVSLTGSLGILMIVIGILLMGLKELPNHSARPAFLIAIVIAVSVSSYSIIDSQAAQTVPNLLYLAVMNLLAPLFASPFLLTRKRGAMASVLRLHKIESIAVAVAGTFAYGIILWAWRQAPPAYVSALRESSVVIAALLGVVSLKETIYRQKALGIILILLGAVLLKLA